MRVALSAPRKHLHVLRPIMIYARTFPPSLSLVYTTTSNNESEGPLLVEARNKEMSPKLRPHRSTSVRMEIKEGDAIIEKCLRDAGLPVTEEERREIEAVAVIAGLWDEEFAERYAAKDSATSSEGESDVSEYKEGRPARKRRRRAPPVGRVMAKQPKAEEGFPETPPANRTLSQKISSSVRSDIQKRPMSGKRRRRAPPVGRVMAKKPKAEEGFPEPPPANQTPSQEMSSEMSSSPIRSDIPKKPPAEASGVVVSNRARKRTVITTTAAAGKASTPGQTSAQNQIASHIHNDDSGFEYQSKEHSDKGYKAGAVSMRHGNSGKKRVEATEAIVFRSVKKQKVGESSVENARAKQFAEPSGGIVSKSSTTGSALVDSGREGQEGGNDLFDRPIQRTPPMGPATIFAHKNYTKNPAGTTTDGSPGIQAGGLFTETVAIPAITREVKAMRPSQLEGVVKAAVQELQQGRKASSNIGEVAAAGASGGIQTGRPSTQTAAENTVNKKPTGVVPQQPEGQVSQQPTTLRRTRKTIKFYTDPEDDESEAERELFTALHTRFGRF